MERNSLPELSILAVHYSRTAITSTLAEILMAIHPWEGYGRRVENYTLGSDSKGGYQKEEDYWRDVKGALLQRMVETPAMKKPVMIILTGDMVATDEFRHVLEEAMWEHVEHIPHIVVDEPMIVAAKGATEFRRRGRAPWQ